MPGKAGRSESASCWRPVSQETGHGTEGTIHEVLEAVRIPLPAITRYSAALGAAALLIAGISACSTSNSSSASSASSAATKPSTLTIATSFAIGDLDPIENGYWGNELGYGELLMKPQLDGTVKPWLLKSLTNPSPTTWVLLNSGIRFQDGKPLNAASLIACMEYQLKSSDSATGSALPGA